MLTDIFWKKIRLEMRLVHIIDKKPSRKIKLDPLSQEQFDISLEAVQEWSPENRLLYREVLQNGMAEYICNRQYLVEFYETLLFPQQSIFSLDCGVNLFSRLKILDVSQNYIQKLQYLPSSCLQLYLDYNQLKDISIKKSTSLQLLSISHNHISDHVIQCFPTIFPQLRCFNFSYNKVINLRNIVNILGQLTHLKILASFNNPISILPFYRSYITEHLHLTYLDGSTIKIQPEIPQQPQKQQEKKEEKKEVKKDDKKDNKKDSKKGGKGEEKPPEPPQVQPPKIPEKKILKPEDFQRIKIEIIISNFEEFIGNSYDASLFPPDTDPKKMQTTFWLKYKLLNETVEMKEKQMLFESATQEEGKFRVNFDCKIAKQFSLNFDNYSYFNEGLRVEVWQTSPKMNKDPETLEIKPVLLDNQVQLVDCLVGGCFVDFAPLHLAEKKQIKFKYRLFQEEAIRNPLFYNSFQDEDQLIKSKKESFQKKLVELQQQTLKKMQEEEAAQLQKKGKDQKKADKKGGKKDGKDSTGQKSLCPPCLFPQSGRIYTVVDQGRMFKGKQLLGIQLNFS